MIRTRFRRCPRLPRASRSLSRCAPPADAAAEPVIRVTNNIAWLGPSKEGPKPRQLLSLPPFPSSPNPLPGRNLAASGPDRPVRVTAISWVKHYFDEVEPTVIQSHFRRGLVSVERSNHDVSSKGIHHSDCLRKIKHNDAMECGMKIYLPVSVAESRIVKRYDTIPTATLHPNADEIEYLRRLVVYKDSAIIVLNKPPKVPVKGNLPVHNSMDALAAAALSYGNKEGPKLVHRLDRESSGLLLMGRKKESIVRLHWLFSNVNLAKTSSQVWNEACEATMQRYWALVIGSPKEKEGIISAPLSKVFLNDGKMERVILAHPSGIDASQDAVTEYRVLGPTINGCSWVELRPLTGRKHQLRVHCAEALGTPIVGDYKYGWFVHKRWKQTPRVDYEPSSGAPYKLRRPECLEVKKGSVLSKVPLLHLHCRETVLPNIAKFLGDSGEWHDDGNPWSSHKPVVLRLDVLDVIADNIDTVQDCYDADRAHENQYRSKYPQHQRQSAEEEPVPHGAQEESLIEELQHVGSADWWGWLGRECVDDDADLGQAGDRERVAEEDGEVGHEERSELGLDVELAVVAE